MLNFIIFINYLLAEKLMVSFQKNSAEILPWCKSRIMPQNCFQTITKHIKLFKFEIFCFYSFQKNLGGGNAQVLGTTEKTQRDGLFISRYIVNFYTFFSNLFLYLFSFLRFITTDLVIPDGLMMHHIKLPERHICAE